MNFIFNKIQTSYKDKRPFVAYRKPNSDIIAAFFQKNDALFYAESFKEKGFVFAPFDDKNKSILIPEDQSEYLEEKFSANKEFIEGNNTSFQSQELLNSSKEHHIKLIKKTIKEINKNRFKKVVISRKEAIRVNDFNLIKTFRRLLNAYPSAMVYVWFHPQIGLWFGASPETLLKINKSRFSTMSLAGTQVYNGIGNVVWGQKEIEEQQLVTGFIETQLRKNVLDLEIDQTETVKAGNLLHLQTKISGKLGIQNPELKTLIKALHPTPAVCGLPREEAKTFIIQNENYDRNFYTGFLGELNNSNPTLGFINSELFVNLRCMEIKNNDAAIFIGGGITKDSNPEKEWEETVSKSNVMKKVL